MDNKDQLMIKCSNCNMEYNESLLESGIDKDLVCERCWKTYLSEVLGADDE